VARLSAHSMAGRSARPSAAAMTSPCICPDSPIAAGRAAAAAVAARAQALTAAHQSPGSLSAYPAAAEVTG
jgi:hypothetical protein